MSPLHRAAACLLLTVNLLGCASHRTTFQDYGAAVESGKLPEYLHNAPRVSDGLAINYANAVERGMRLKFTGSRVTREISSTTQVALAAFGGAAAAFNYSATTVAALSLSSAGIPELQRIFNAKGRAEVYKDAAQMIRRGILEYYAQNPNPPSNAFTPNGLILVQRVSSAIDMVDDVLAGQMPSQMEMLEAVEPMTPQGTRPHSPGTVPINSISANPSSAARVKAAMPEPSPRRSLSPDAKPANVDVVEEGIRKDRRDLGAWLSERIAANDTAALRDLLKAGGVTETVDDKNLKSRARQVLENATSRSKVDALLPVMSRKPAPNPGPANVAPPMPIDPVPPTPVNPTDPAVKPLFPEPSKPR